MRFIEDLLGISPDGGSGVLEVLLILALVACVVAVTLAVGSAARKRQER